MDVKCPNCGATNRNTSRFCARCGEALPETPQNAERKDSGEMNLPWLQAVQDRAVQRTDRLHPSQIGESEDDDLEEEIDPAPATPVAAQPSSQQKPAEETATQVEQTPQDQPQEATPDEPPPDW